MRDRIKKMYFYLDMKPLKISKKLDVNYEYVLKVLGRNLNQETESKLRSLNHENLFRKQT